MVAKYDVDYDTFFPMQALTEGWASICFPIANSMVDFFGGSSRPVIVIGGLIGVTSLYLSAVLKLHPYLFLIIFTLGLGAIKAFYK